MATAFQYGAFQFGAFQINAVVGGSSGRKQPTIDTQNINPRIYQDGLKTLYAHIAAVNLGRKGGIESGKSRNTR